MRAMRSHPEPVRGLPHLAGRLVRGIRLGLPVFLGYVPVGTAFGMLTRTSGFSAPQALACSALVLRGAGRFVGLTLMPGPGRTW